MRWRDAVTAAPLGAAALFAWCAIAAAEPRAGGIASLDAQEPAPPPPPSPGSNAPDPAAPPPPSPTSEPPPPDVPANAEPPPPAATPPPPPAAAPPPDTGAATEPDDIGDQGIGGAIGLAAGGRATAGGLRVTGHYLYQLAERDWFDGIASFTFGGGDAGCFRDRSDAVICQHGLASGGSIEIAAGVRRLFDAQGPFRPFARAAVGISLVRFSSDHITGCAIPLHVGAGLRASVTPSIAVVALADLTLGFGLFGRGLGGEPQLGLAVTAGAEFRLR